MKNKGLLQERLRERIPGRRTRQVGRRERSAFALGSCLVLMGPLGCGRKAAPRGASSAEPAVFAKAFIAQPCAAIVPVGDRTSPPAARVFVEVAHLMSGELPEPVGAFLAEHAVPVDQVAGLLASNGVSGSAPWGQCVDDACSSSSSTLSVVPHLSAPASAPFEIELSITPANASGKSQEQMFAAQLMVTNQRPLVVPVGEGRVVVTPYLIGSEADLAGLYRCKANQRDAEADAG